MLWDNLLQRLYRGLFENSKDAIFITTKDGLILDANQAFLEMFGYLEEELLTMNEAELFVNPADREDHIREIGVKGAVKDLEVRLKKKEGRESDCLISSSVHYATDGSVLGYQSIVRDITKRKRAEKLQSVAYSIADAAYRGMDLGKLFRYIHEKLSSIIDTRNFYIALYHEDKGTVSFPYYVDENYSDTNYKPLERKLNGGITDYVIKSGKSFFATGDTIKQLARDKVFELIGPVPLVWLGIPLINKDKIIGVIAVQSYSSAAQYTKNDLELLDFVSGQIAITIERKQAEESLKTSTENLNALIENTPSGIFSLDNRLKLVTFNSAFTRQMKAAYSAVPAIGLSPEDLLPKEEVRTWVNFLKRGLKGEHTIREQKYKINNQVKHYEISVSPILTGTHEINGITVFVKNVTQMKRAQEVLLQMTRQKFRQELQEQKIRAEAMIEGQDEERQRIAFELHDGLGQMLTAIKLNLANLNVADKKQMSRQIREIKQLINETMAETKRVSQNLMPSILKDFGLVPTMELLCENNSKGSSTRIIFQSFGVKGRYDSKIERGLYRIAQEAINNSLKYSKANEINVQLLQKDERVRLMIEDDGIGFEVNNITNGNNVRKYANGLYNMRERAALLRGTINIDSSPGNGAVITVEVPIKI